MKEPVPSQARTFLEALFAGKPDELHLLVWTLPEKRSHWFTDLGGAIRFAESLGEHDLYVGVGLSERDYGPTRRCLSNEVIGIVGLWADLDLKSEAHSKTLPATVEDALQILPEQLPPTFVVRTGNGLHAWWLFREPLIFESDEERRNAGNLALRWQSLLGANAAARGWAFDRLADLARVLRIPGTKNCKDTANPKPVEIYRQTDRRYNPSDFEEYLEELAIPDAEGQERTAQAWKENFSDKPLTIDPSATVPEDLLARYLSADHRFEKTWRRQRDDLKDQSQSGYDLALANFGSEAGLSEQQIVDLMIHHRRIHNQRQRTRLDYFQRTLAKAIKRTDGGGSNTLPEAPPFHHPDSDGHADAGQQRTRPDSATARALLCDRISTVLGVRVLRILKITGKEPTYQVELEASKIELPSVSKLVDQRSFRMAIASAADRLIPKIKPKLWEQVAQAMLDALTIEDGGEETDFVGSVRIHLESYLSETPFIDSIEEQPIQTRRKPTIIDGKIAICSSDLQSHINKTNNENHSVKAVASMLAALGASSTRVRGARLRDQSRWLLPVAEFAPDDFAGTDKEAPHAEPS
ncbi:MAG: DNA-primase RepB domain-containing protein [Bryobacteraceae bacterium]|nr:DNA-primase RepB domain-containing protein [Bryobacteraceae bacterium]